MSEARGRVAEAVQLRALCQTFLARFFEGESTAGRSDLRDSFFWIVAALATPGLMLPIYEQFHWYDIAKHGGPAALAAAALFDKTVYLSLTFVAIGFVSAVAWPALLVERRDGWILGGLPVRSRTVILAKIGALSAYIGLISAGMHTGAAVLFGGFLGSVVSWTAMARGMAGHFVAAFGLSVFTFTSVTGLAAACYALAGPRQFARLSTVLQLALVATVTSALIVLPSLAALSESLAGPAPQHAWITRMPPTWFLGLDAAIAGMSTPALDELARTAGTALIAALALVAAMFPLAGFRAMSSVARPVGAAPHGLAGVLARTLATSIARAPETRGAAQFALSTIGRVNGHRLVLTMALGLGLVAVVPAVLAWLPRDAGSFPAHPVASWLAAPLVLMYFGLAGLRIALAMPSELTARWLFAAAPSPMFSGRDAMRRLLVTLGVLPALLVSGIVWFALWGAVEAMPLVLVTGLAGWLLVEIHAWGFVGIPCARPLAPGAANLQARWPAYFIGLLLFCVQLPFWEVAAGGSLKGWAWLIGVLATATAVVRHHGQQSAWINGVTGDPQGLLMLDLTAPRPKPPRLPETDYPRIVISPERPPHA